MARTAAECAVACALLLAIGLAGAQAANSAAKSTPDAPPQLPLFEATARYNSLPWHFTIDKLYAFATSPLKKAPTNTLTYTGYPTWPFTSGPGWLVAIKFADSPIAAYSELFYIPGTFKPSCSNRNYNSVQRIWVDSPASRHAGRSIWGIPKELATFDWRDSDSSSESKWTSVTVTDDASGKVFFHANLTDIELGRGVNLPSWLIPSNIRSVLQWPIDDSAHTYLGSAEAFANTNIAEYTTMKAGTSDMRPVLTELDFTGRSMRTAQARDLMLDAETFTGDANATLSAIPLAMHLQEGSQAMLSAPVFVDDC